MASSGPPLPGMETDAWDAPDPRQLKVQPVARPNAPPPKSAPPGPARVAVPAQTPPLDALEPSAPPAPPAPPPSAPLEADTSTLNDAFSSGEPELPWADEEPPRQPRMGLLLGAAALGFAALMGVGLVSLLWSPFSGEVQAPMQASAHPVPEAAAVPAPALPAPAVEVPPAPVPVAAPVAPAPRAVPAPRPAPKAAPKPARPARPRPRPVEKAAPAAPPPAPVPVPAPAPQPVEEASPWGAVEG